MRWRPCKYYCWWVCAPCVHASACAFIVPSPCATGGDIVIGGSIQAVGAGSGDNVGAGAGGTVVLIAGECARARLCGGSRAHAFTLRGGNVAGGGIYEGSEFYVSAAGGDTAICDQRACSAAGGGGRIIAVLWRTSNMVQYTD